MKDSQSLRPVPPREQSSPLPFRASLCLFVAIAQQRTIEAPNHRALRQRNHTPSKTTTTKMLRPKIRSYSSAAPRSAFGKPPTPSPVSPSSTAASAARTITDILHYADRIVFKYKPRLIVFYSGDNDLASGRTSDRVFADFQTFANSVRKRLPDTPIIYLAIKPSASRWKHWPQMQDVNSRVKQLADEPKQQTHLHRYRPRPPRRRRPTPQRTLPRRQSPHEPRRLRRLEQTPHPTSQSHREVIKPPSYGMVASATMYPTGAPAIHL